MNKWPALAGTIAAIAMLIAAAFTLFGCSSGGAAATPSGPASGVAYLRMVNASPDIETSAPQGGGAATCDFNSADASIGPLIAVQVDGAQAVASFPYRSVSGYAPVAAGPASVTIVYPSSVPNGCPNLSFSTPVLAAGSSYTLVVAGQYAKKTLGFTLFADATGAPDAQFYNVSPATGTIDAGTFTPGQANFTFSASVAVGKSAKLPIASSAPGIAYYAGSGTTPVATIEPSAIDGFDVSNVIPYNNQSHFSVFLIDGNAAGGSAQPQLAGGFN